MIVKRVGPLSLAKLLGAMYGVIGLIAGCIFALMSVVGAGFGAMAGGDEAVPAWIAGLFGVGAVFFLPLFYGGMGFVAGAISGLLYNVFAQMIGGIVVELE